MHASKGGKDDGCLGSVQLETTAASQRDRCEAWLFPQAFIILFAQVVSHYTRLDLFAIVSILRTCTPPPKCLVMRILRPRASC